MALVERLRCKMKILIAISMTCAFLVSTYTPVADLISKKAKIKIKHCPPNSSPMCTIKPKVS
jgi:hypothetical protein